MVKMGYFARCMDLSSYAFCGNLHLPRLTSRHPGRHRITSPAAQGQQGDHHDEEQAMHAKVRRRGLKSSIYQARKIQIH